MNNQDRDPIQLRWITVWGMERTVTVRARRRFADPRYASMISADVKKPPLTGPDGGLPVAAG